jgi:argininosuccinate lyase
MSINQEKVKQHIPKELFAAHWAYVLVKEEYMPFREAYRYVKDHLDEIPDFDCADLLKKACSQGSTGNLQLNSAQKRSRLERTYWWEQSKQFQKKIHNILT